MAYFHISVKTFINVMYSQYYELKSIFRLKIGTTLFRVKLK